MKRISLTNILTVAFAATGLLAGCGGEGFDEPIDIEQEEVGLGCDTDTADATFTGKIDPAHTTPSSYGPWQGANSCYQGYITNVNSIQAAYTGNGNAAPARIVTTWNGGSASNATACQQQWMETIFYRRQNNAWVKIGTTQVSTGQWIQAGPLAFCQSPGATLTGMVAGSSYRIVGSARQGGPLGSLRSFKVQTLKPVNIQ